MKLEIRGSSLRVGAPFIVVVERMTPGVVAITLAVDGLGGAFELEGSSPALSHNVYVPQKGSTTLTVTYWGGGPTGFQLAITATSDEAPFSITEFRPIT